MSESQTKGTVKFGKPKGEPKWWDHEQHPMTDSEFTDAYCAYIFRTQDDITIRTMRNRLRSFIVHFFGRVDLPKQLAEYRKDFPNAL